MNISQFIKMFLSENDGTPSSIRVVSTIVPLVVVGVWAYICVKQGQLVTPDWEDIAMLVGLPAAKVWQKGKEVLPGGGK